jgi:VWFA-related protein
MIRFSCFNLQSKTKGKMMAGKFWYRLILFFSIGLAFHSSRQLLPCLPSTAAQSESIFKFRVDVELTSLEVIALDKNGNPVPNLKKDDFQLYEDGRKQDILSVDEVKAESKASSLGASLVDEISQHRGKTVLVIFDDTSIQPHDIKASRDSAEKFVKAHMRPQDLFAVAGYGMSMQVFQNFTADRDEVLKAIGRPAASNAGRGTIYFENLLRSLEKVCYSIARIKGRKSILIFSQSLSLGDLAAGYFISSGNNGIYEKTLASARKSNVIFYVVNPGTLSISGSAQRFPATVPASGMSPTPGMGSLRTSVDSSLTFSLGSLAAESGGFSISDTNEVDIELDKLDRQISNYYVLGFQSNNPKHDGAFRKLEVRSELTGITLKHLEGYQDRSPIDVLISSKQEKSLMAALASPRGAARIPIVFRPLYFYDSPKVARVLVTARFLMDKMPFKKKGKQMGTDLSIMGAAYAENGSLAARFSETTPIRFDKDEEREFRNRSYIYRNYFKLHPGRYRLKLAVLDESNNLGSMEQLLEVPEFPDRKLAGSSLVIAEQISRLPDLIENLQTHMLDESDPLLYAGAHIKPNIENKLPAGAAIPVMFRIYNLPGEHRQWNVTIKAKLVDEDQKEYVLAPVFLKKGLSPASKTEAVAGFQLSFPNTPPGRCRLIIEVSETTSLKSVTLNTDVEFPLGAQDGKQKAASSENKTVINMTVEELRDHYPLRPQEIIFSENQEDLNLILKKAGERVQDFFRDFSDTSSKEQVILRRFRPSGLEASDIQSFNYLILFHQSNGQPLLQEYRTDNQNREIDQDGIEGFLITSGYSGLSIIFHPQYHQNSSFRYLGKQTSGSRAHIIVFAQKPETGGYLFNYRDTTSGESTPLPLQGMVWLDPDTYQILRIRTNLLAEGEQSIISKQTTDIQFGEVQFDGIPQKVWLPREVRVDITSSTKNYLNYHRYSDYKLFSTNNEFKIDKLKNRQLMPGKDQGASPEN